MTPHTEFLAKHGFTDLAKFKDQWGYTIYDYEHSEDRYKRIMLVDLVDIWQIIVYDGESFKNNNLYKDEIAAYLERLFL